MLRLHVGDVAHNGTKILHIIGGIAEIKMGE